MEVHPARIDYRNPRMGRVKLKIKRLESTSNRQVTYSKRRSGILKKARELSILCDIDIILLMFSPTEKPTLFTGERSTVEEVVAKFAQLTPQERAKRKLESLETLKKTFKKFDHDVVIQDFLGSSNQSVAELTDRVALMQAQLTDLHRRLSYWRNVDQINNVEHLGQMEVSLRESINRINVHKENLRNSQVLPLDCGDQVQQFQSGMSLPLMMSATQETQPVPWLPNNGQQCPLTRPRFSLTECSADVPLPSFTEYFGTGKQTEIGNSGSLDNIAQEGGSLSELSNSGCLNLQPNDQFLYPSNGSLNIPENKTLKAEMEMHLKGSHDVYQVGNNFELPRPVFHDGHLPWMPASGSCGLAMNNWNSFHQH